MITRTSLSRSGLAFGDEIGVGVGEATGCTPVVGGGTGKVNKFAEIVAATVLCGELSLGSAIVAEEWVKAHDLFGRNR